MADPSSPFPPGFDKYLTQHEHDQAEARLKHPAEPSLFLDRLVREWKGTPGRSPVDVARRILAAGEPWEQALATLKRAYDEPTTGEAWWHLVAHKDSAWSMWNEEYRRWLPYCVPGYSALCGDVLEGGRLDARREAQRPARGVCPWGRSGVIELSGLPPDRYPSGAGVPFDYVETGLIDEGDPQRRVYRLEAVPCPKAPAGTVPRRIIAPPGRYHLGVDSYDGVGDGRGNTRQNYYGDWGFTVAPGETVAIVPEGGRYVVKHEGAPVKAAGGPVAVARRNWKWGLVAIGAVVAVGVAIARSGDGD